MASHIHKLGTNYVELSGQLATSATLAWGSMGYFLGS
jgi:hypothetical protein